MKSQNKKLLIFIIAMLISSMFLTITKPQSAKAQSDFLFNDNFDTNQPNSQFTFGSNDVLNSTDYFSATHSLQVSSKSGPLLSHATFNNVTGQIYVNLFYKTNNTGYSNILQLVGETAYIGIYQDQNGVIFDWDYAANETHVLLSPNVWYNITLSLYLDPNHGSNSSAKLWLNGLIIASQEMPQLDGYEINTLVFDTIQVWQASNKYDDISFSGQSIIVPSPTPEQTPTPTPTSTPIPTSTPTSTPTQEPTVTPNPSAIPTSNPIATPTSTRRPEPTSLQTPSATHSLTPTIPEFPFVLAISAFFAITGVMLSYLKRQSYNNHSSFHHD